MATTKEKAPIPETPKIIPSIKPDVTSVACTGTPQNRTESCYKEKSYVDAFILSFVPIFGFFGSHHFYLGRTWMGLAYCLTFGLLGVGYVVDICRTPHLVREYNQKVRRGECPVTSKRSLTDTYLLWFPCGLFGLHHFYLRNYKFGVLYLFTVGFFGIGWLIDFFRIPSLVQEANNEVPEERDSLPAPKSLCLAYVLAFPPLGLLGVHHFYLNRPIWGILYANTAGGFGLGWVFDLIRMPILVNRVNNSRLQHLPGPYTSCNKPENKYIDDAFILWCPPLGLFGAHHFYLGRIGWGFLYFFTVGCLGVGWIFDIFRLQALVEDYNQDAEEKRRIKDHVARTYVNPGQQNGGDSTNVVLTNPVDGAFSPMSYPPQAWPAAPYPENLQVKPFAPAPLPPGYSPNYPTSPPSYTDAMGDHIYPQLPPKGD